MAPLALDSVDSNDCDVTSDATATVTQTQTVMPTSTSEDQDGACSGSDVDQNNKVAAVGAGVGASLGACLLLALAMLFWQRRAGQRKIRELQAVLDSSRSNSVAGLWSPVTQQYRHPSGLERTLKASELADTQRSSELDGSGPRDMNLSKFS